MRQKLASITQSFRLPTICTLCSQFHLGTLAVCHDCQHWLRPLGPSCQHCAYPLSSVEHLICGQCIKTKPHFDRAYIAYPFEEPLRSLLHQFKYHNGLYLKSFLGELMLKVSIDLQGQCLIPVPMHPLRLKQRGFNQAAVLTQYLAKTLQVPYDLFSCRKIINTAPQASLDGDLRRKNLRNAFEIKALPYQHVILIDDLLTTGSTANELARAFKKSGVQRVDVWCCARTVYA
ncbi:MAG: ComF family protein [Legionella sp.]|nr:MAG: ComF family protein [Legionella sp.]